MWQKWGLRTVLGFTILSVILKLLSRFWFYQLTVWYQGLVVVNYPPSVTEREILRMLGLPRLYDVPHALHERAIMFLTSWSLSIAWWFFLGAMAALIWQRARVVLRRHQVRQTR
jgi:hypothetical protein